MKTTLLESRFVAGDDGQRVFCKSYGNPEGQSVIFLHGTSCTHDFWRIQTSDPELAKKYHMIAIDLRGHGYSDSENNAETYSNYEGWAGDLNAVIESYGLKKTVLCGWSFGGIVMGYYLRKYGASALGGTAWVSTLAGLANDEGESFVGPLYPAIFEDFTSEDIVAIHRAAVSFVDTLAVKPGAAAEMPELVAATMMTRPATRISMFAEFQHAEYIAAVDHKALVIHGDKDQVVLPLAGKHIADNLSNCDVKNYADSGHVPFWEEKDRFNADLSVYLDEIARSN